MKRLFFFLLLLGISQIKAQEPSFPSYLKAGVLIQTPSEGTYFTRPFGLIQHAFSEKNQIEYGISMFRIQKYNFPSALLTYRSLAFSLQYNRIFLSKWDASLYVGGGVELFYNSDKARTLYSFSLTSYGVRPYTGLGLMWRTPGRWMFEVFVPLLTTEIRAENSASDDPSLPQKNASTKLDAAFGYGIRLGTGVRLTK